MTTEELVCLARNNDELALVLLFTIILFVSLSKSNIKNKCI